MRLDLKGKKELRGVCAKLEGSEVQGIKVMGATSRPVCVEERGGQEGAPAGSHRTLTSVGSTAREPPII